MFVSKEDGWQTKTNSCPQEGYDEFIDTGIGFSTVNIQFRHPIYDSFLLDSRFVFFKKRVKIPLSYFKIKHDFILVFQLNHWTETIHKTKEGFKKKSRTQ